LFFSNQFILNKNLQNNQTEANLFHIKANVHYKKLILGISHARNLSRGLHHQLFEVKYGKTINLAIGENLNGLEIQYVYFKYFLDQGNTTDSIYLILSPTLLFDNSIDKNDIAFYKEPIKMEFLEYLVKNSSVTKDQIFHYLKSKLSHHWIVQQYYSNEANNNYLTQLDTSVIRKGMALAYPFRLNETIFTERMIKLSQLIALAKKENIGIKIIIPPALFGKWPGHDKIKQHIDKKKFAIKDLSESILEPSFYYDHHHLNTRGIKNLLNLM
jgi:hypothetical protein